MVELVTSWETLMMYARAVGEARKEGDPEKIKEAEEAHEAYRQMCLKADRIILPVPKEDL